MQLRHIQNQNYNLSTNLVGANEDKFSQPRLKHKKQISFGSIKNTVTKPGFLGKTGFFIKKVLDKTLQNGVSQNFANAINYGGKAIISPLMILAASPFTDEKEDSVKYSMLMQPVQAGLAFASSLGLSILANRAFDKAAKRGNLGKFIDPALGKFFQNEAYLRQFKGVSTAVMTAVVIPVTSVILFWSLPRIMKKLDKDEPASAMPHKNSYAQKLSEQKLFSAKIRPEFGMLTQNRLSRQ